MDNMLDGIKTLDRADIQPGQRWIYSADFNVPKKEIEQKNSPRVESEIRDMKYLLGRGANITILAHQKRYGSAESFKRMIPYLQEKLGYDIVFTGPSEIEKAAELSKSSRVVLVDNMRFHEGEEKNDDSLVQRLISLGDHVACGGFGKAHRANASNVGIITLRPAYMAVSMAEEIRKLQPYAGNDSKFSVAVLGGVKKEKLTTGLDGLAALYDYIIPGGLVLNCILKAKGKEIGVSLTSDENKDYAVKAKKICERYEDKIYIPEKLIVADWKTLGGREIVSVEQGVPEDKMIVDYIIEGKGLTALDTAADIDGRILLAGTPGIYNKDFCEATDAVLLRMRRCKKALVLGGDTASEVRFDNFSTGGGSALELLVVGKELAILGALRKNAADPQIWK